MELDIKIVYAVVREVFGMSVTKASYYVCDVAGIKD